MNTNDIMVLIQKYCAVQNTVAEGESNHRKNAGSEENLLQEIREAIGQIVSERDSAQTELRKLLIVLKRFESLAFGKIERSPRNQNIF